MKKTLFILTIALASSSLLAADRPRAAELPRASAARLDIGRSIERINTLDNNPALAKVGLSAVSKETGVSVARLEEQVKEYHTGTGGLLVCNELAKATGKPVSTFLKARAENRGWEHIANEYKFDLSKVVPKLDRVQAAMENAQSQIKNKR